jgi:alpha-galactosidase
MKLLLNISRKLAIVLTILSLVTYGCTNKSNSVTQTPATTDAGVKDNLALTPPMGWNSWNPFGKNVSEKVIRETADAMVSSAERCRIYIHCLTITGRGQETRLPVS